jgi:hypothetical protein
MFARRDVRWLSITYEFANVDPSGIRAILRLVVHATTPDCDNDALLPQRLYGA